MRVLIRSSGFAFHLPVRFCFFFLPQRSKVLFDPQNSLEHKVKEIMHKAFWDYLEDQLKGDPPTYTHAIKLLAEIKEVR